VIVVPLPAAWDAATPFEYRRYTRYLERVTAFSDTSPLKTPAGGFRTEPVGTCVLSGTKPCSQPLLRPNVVPVT
jgi:hypothetical protein